MRMAGSAGKDHGNLNAYYKRAVAHIEDEALRAAVEEQDYKVLGVE